MSYQATVLARSPAMYVPCTEATGNVFSDVTGTGHEGVQSVTDVSAAGTPSFLVGEYAAQLSYNGASDRGTLGISTAEDLPFYNSPCTYEVWSKPSTLNYVWQLSIAGGGSYQSQAWLGGFYGPGAQIVLQGSWGTVHCDQDTNHPECWRHYVWTSDGAGAITYYINGIPIGTSSIDLDGTEAITGLRIREYPLSPVYVAHIAVYRQALTAEEVLANYQAATPRQDAACYGGTIPNEPPPTIRLVHQDGDTCWEHNGARWRVRSGGTLAEEHDGTTRKVYSGATLVFQTPFPVNTGPTPSYLGLDPATGLPVVAPLPAFALLPPAVGTPMGATCVQVRCGAADALANKLADIYHTVEQWVQPALTGLLAGFFDALAGAGFSFLDLVTDGLGLTLTGGELSMVLAINRAIGTLSAAVLGDALPYLNTDQQTWLKRAAFDSLVCTNDTVQLDGAQMDAWYSRILNASGDPPNFGAIQQEALYAIVGWGRDLALSEWAAAANTGAHSPSSACDSWS